MPECPVTSHLAKVLYQSARGGAGAQLLDALCFGSGNTVTAVQFCHVGVCPQTRNQPSHSSLASRTSPSLTPPPCAMYLPRSQPVSHVYVDPPHTLSQYHIRYRHNDIPALATAPLMALSTPKPAYSAKLWRCLDYCTSTVLCMRGSHACSSTLEGIPSPASSIATQGHIILRQRVHRRLPPALQPRVYRATRRTMPTAPNPQHRACSP